ncbi:MAG: sugar phosphate nucleotidyltransferase [Desulfobacterales bacterium]
MKALVLAAGFGTRLLPHTRTTPKPLFTVNGRPLLDWAIRRLIEAGVEAVVVNTHHLNDRIEAFIGRASYSIPVLTRHEPEILGTGGAIRNVADFLGGNPFWVVNSDIYTDIDFSAVARFHLARSEPATLVLVDDPEFNTVTVDADGHVVGFDAAAGGSQSALTFTGIQILEPVIFEYLPPAGFASSIDTYREMLRAGKTLNAWVASGSRWSDLGTPERYRQVAMEEMVRSAAAEIGKADAGMPIDWTQLAGDGSNRRWHRVRIGNSRWVMAEHGLRTSEKTAEVDAFVAIGRHLFGRGLPVPRIVAADTFSGLVLLEDLGDLSFQDHVRAARSEEAVEGAYQEVIDLLIRLSVEGGKDFDPSWTWQTRAYDRTVIVEMECRYFLEAFVLGKLDIETDWSDLSPEFDSLAERVLAPGLGGFMHRDFQSRNLMVRNGRCFLIDFQGGRLGPITYDLASLLIDPYTDLPAGLKDRLLSWFIDRYGPLSGLSPGQLRDHYRLCSLARNLQMLGAFGHLTRVRGKSHFEASIPIAVRNLKHHPLLGKGTPFPRLARLVRRLPD